MAKQEGLRAYEDRYRRVFAAGALRWSVHHCHIGGRSNGGAAACPKGRMPSLEGYVQELERCGFRVRSATRSGGANTPCEAVILADRT